MMYIGLVQDTSPENNLVQNRGEAQMRAVTVICYLQHVGISII